MNISGCSLRWRQFSYWVACGFGLGWIGRFPGTAGSIAICPLLWWASQQLSALNFALVGVAGFVLGLHLCAQAIAYTGKTDPSQVVWDEFTGLWLAMVFLPPTLPLLLLALVIFRILDICKPPPISVVERRVPGALGVMADDALAGILTNCLLQALVLLWPAPFLLP